MSCSTQQQPPWETHAEQGLGQKGFVGTPQVLLLRISKGHCDSLALRRGQGSGVSKAAEPCRAVHSQSATQRAAVANTVAKDARGSAAAWQDWGYSRPEPWVLGDGDSEDTTKNKSLKSGLPLMRSKAADPVVRSQAAVS